MKRLLTKLVPAICLSLALVALNPPLVYADAIYIINGAQQTENTAQAQDDLKIIQPYFTYTDYPSGYSLSIPVHMAPDLATAAVRTVFSDTNTQIEIYYDNFSGTISSASDYVHYGNRQTISSPHHFIQRDEWVEVNGYRVHILEWNRRKLAKIINDKNYYFSAEIIKNENEVYTIFIKSSVPIDNAMDITGSLRIFEKTGTVRNYIQNRPHHPKLSSETANFMKQYFSPSSTLTWGIFEPSAPETMNYLLALERKLEYKFPFLIRYQGLDEQAPIRGLEKAYQDNRYIELTLQTTHSDEVNALIHQAGRNTGVMYAILDGQYDEYLTEYARRLKAFGHPVLMRLNNEMNGDWCWYSAYYSGKDTDIYKAVWKYIHTLFADTGADNVVWVWNPHDVSRPDFKWNNYLMYYPGDEYVDIIGLTGYNTGTYFEGESWRSFSDIYPPLYAEYSASFAKPFMITEFGSNSVGGSKQAWIESMFDQIRQFPNIKAAIWWSGTDYDQQGNAGRIYVLDETDKTTEVFHNRLQEYRNDLPMVSFKQKLERGSLAYPQIPNPPHLTAFNQTLQTDAEAFARELSKPHMSGSLDYRVERNSGGIISLKLRKFSYADRAAHPMTTWKSFTYNSRTGSAYGLKDLFKPGTAFESELLKHINYQIADRQLQLLRPYAGITPDQEFFLTPDSLVLYHQLYEYTPYAYGFLTFTIPLEDLKTILKEDIDVSYP